mgnify:CR=1 FL=1
MACIVDVKCICCGESKPQVFNQSPIPFLCSDYCKTRYKLGKCEWISGLLPEPPEKDNG